MIQLIMLQRTETSFKYRVILTMAMMIHLQNTSKRNHTHKIQHPTKSLILSCLCKMKYYFKRGGKILQNYLLI